MRWVQVILGALLKQATCVRLAQRSGCAQATYSTCSIQLTGMMFECQLLTASPPMFPDTVVGRNVGRNALSACTWAENLCLLVQCLPVLHALAGRTSGICCGKQSCHLGGRSGCLLLSLCGSAHTLSTSVTSSCCILAWLGACT